MGQYSLVVQIKSRKDTQLRELYPSEDEAKAALRDLIEQVEAKKAVCLSKGGAIAFPYGEFVSARVMPHQSGGTVRAVH